MNQYSWTMEITTNRVPKYNDRTGLDAVRYCIEESMARELGRIVQSVTDLDCVTVTPVMIP